MADLAAGVFQSVPKISQYRWPGTDISERFDVENRATGEVVITVQAGDEGTANPAVQAAQEAFGTHWRWKTRTERSAFLDKAADELQKHSQELTVLLCLENGKPWRGALHRCEVPSHDFPVLCFYCGQTRD